MRNGKKNGRMTLWGKQGLKQWIKVYVDDVYIRDDPL